jgi:hypothetical protein
VIELKIYVPAPESAYRRSIKAGSGIVGTFVNELDARIKIDYEGAIHQQGMTWEEKIFHAAGRHVANYPTVARAWVEPAEMIEVGTFTCTDSWKNRTYAITNSEALEAWKRGS